MSTPTRFLPSPMLASRASLSDQAILTTKLWHSATLTAKKDENGGELSPYCNSFFLPLRPHERVTVDPSMPSPGRSRTLFAAKILRFALASVLAMVLVCSLTGSAAAVPNAEPRTHIVYPGQTLGMIAKRYNVTLEALRAANQLKIGERIKPSAAPGHSRTGRSARNQGTKGIARVEDGARCGRYEIGYPRRSQRKSTETKRSRHPGRPSAGLADGHVRGRRPSAGLAGRHVAAAGLRPDWPTPSPSSRATTLENRESAAM